MVTKVSRMVSHFFAASSPAGRQRLAKDFSPRHPAVPRGRLPTPGSGQAASLAAVSLRLLALGAGAFGFSTEALFSAGAFARWGVASSSAALGWRLAAFALAAFALLCALAFALALAPLPRLLVLVWSVLPRRFA